MHESYMIRRLIIVPFSGRRDSSSTSRSDVDVLRKRLIVATMVFDKWEWTFAFGRIEDEKCNVHISPWMSFVSTQSLHNYSICIKIPLPFRK